MTTNGKLTLVDGNDRAVRLDMEAGEAMTEAEAKTLLEAAMGALAECIGPDRARFWVLTEVYELWGLPRTWTATEAPGRAFGAFMRYRRDNLGLSFDKVADKIGVNVPRLMQMEQGRGITAEDTALLFAWGRALGMDEVWTEGLIRTGFYLPEPTKTNK